ncbi:Random slug protein 5 [Tetrabaena socialis]|uniref:Random slug protein 5 n=1 Tax=Tetrabaena socialis TaxID=47790 RepID=A0A2J7ZUU4_9CHLO|nr:Random slug protein 5 [Tetrabaena socialis]|eukprot:PNH04045.1 Random slug protein 5 [Tetrabaena socialis]
MVGGLNDTEKQLVAALKAEVAPIVGAHAALQAFCNEHTYVRYLRARGWNLQKASKMLKATLEWRLDYKPHLIKWEEVQSESTTGKQFVYHTIDKEGRPIVMMRPRNQNTKDTEKQIRHLIYTLEVAARQADKSGVGKFTWLLDFGGYSMSNAPPLKVSIHCNSVLANHYPERLGLACCYHAPTLFTMTWRAVQPFVDPVTKQKIVFIVKGPTEQGELAARFDLDQIETCMGGRLEHAYDHEKYGMRMHEFDKEVAAELEHIRLQMDAAAAAADHQLAAADAQGLAEATEQLAVAAS